MCRRALLLCAYTGIRGGELAALRKEDCTADSLYIHQTETTYKDRDTGKNVCKIRDNPKTKNSIRKVEIPKQGQWIIPQLKTLNPYNEWLISSYNNKTKNHVRAREEYFRKALYQSCKAVDIPERGLHTLRKTYASALLDTPSISQKTVKELMGHSDITTTYNSYAYSRRTGTERIKEMGNAEILNVLENGASVTEV